MRVILRVTNCGRLRGDSWLNRIALLRANLPPGAGRRAGPHSRISSVHKRSTARGAWFRPLPAGAWDGAAGAVHLARGSNTSRACGQVSSMANASERVARKFMLSMSR